MRVGKLTRGGELPTGLAMRLSGDQMTHYLDDCNLMTMAALPQTPAEVRGSFQETAPRKTTENTVKHHDGVRW